MLRELRVLKEKKNRRENLTKGLQKELKGQQK